MRNAQSGKVMDMTRCSLGNFLGVPTFVTRRLNICNAARDPSGERWNYLSRRLTCNFALMTAFTPFRYLFLDLRTCICTNYCFLSECSTYSLSLPCMRLDHDSGQVMKFVYMRITCSVTLLNMRLKLELNQLKQQVLFFCLYILYLLNMSSKHLTLPVMKYV